MTLERGDGTVTLAIVTSVLIATVLASRCAKCPPGHEPATCSSPRRSWTTQCRLCPTGFYSSHWSRVAYCRPCADACPTGYFAGRACSATKNVECRTCAEADARARSSPSFEASCRTAKRASPATTVARRLDVALAASSSSSSYSDKSDEGQGRRLGSEIRTRQSIGYDAYPGLQTNDQLRVRPADGAVVDGVTSAMGQTLPQKGGRPGGVKAPRAMSNVGIYVGIGIGIAALVVIAIIIWCCCRHRHCCCRRRVEEEADDPSKPTYVAMTPITPGEKEHIVFPLSASPARFSQLPNGDVEQGGQLALGLGPIDIPCLGLLLEDGDTIKFIDESSSDDEFACHVHDETRSLDQEYLIAASVSPAYVAPSPSLSTRPLLKSDCDQSMDTPDSSFLHSSDSVLTEKTPIDDLDQEVVFSSERASASRKRQRRDRSPDPFAREDEEDAPLLSRGRTREKDECNWWETHSSSSEDETVDGKREMIPILIGHHHQGCPVEPPHSLTELERQFDAMISDWEQFQAGNIGKDTCPYYIYEDQALETIPESPEFDYQESDHSRRSSMNSAVYPWRRVTYVRHPPPPSDTSDESDESDGMSLDETPPQRFSADLDDQLMDVPACEDGPGLLMHSPQIEDLRSIGVTNGANHSDSNSERDSSASSLDQVLEINAANDSSSSSSLDQVLERSEGHDNEAVLWSSSEEEFCARGKVASTSSMLLEQKLSIVRPGAFVGDDFVVRPRSMIDDRAMLAQIALPSHGDSEVPPPHRARAHLPRLPPRPRSMPASMPDEDFAADDSLKIPLRTKTETSSESSSSSSESTDGSSDSSDDSLIHERDKPNSVVFENKMYQD